MISGYHFRTGFENDYNLYNNICYPKCKNCEQMGTARNNMCTECYSNYTLIETN